MADPDPERTTVVDVPVTIGALGAIISCSDADDSLLSAESSSGTSSIPTIPFDARKPTCGFGAAPLTCP